MAEQQCIILLMDFVTVTTLFQRFPMTEKMNFHDLSTQHIFFQNKRYTIYESLPE